MKKWSSQWLNLDRPGSRGTAIRVIPWCFFLRSAFPLLSPLPFLFWPFSPLSTIFHLLSLPSLPFAASPSSLFSYLLSHFPTPRPSFPFSLLPTSSPSFISSLLPHPSPALPLRFLYYHTQHLCTWCSEEHQDQSETGPAQRTLQSSRS